MGTFPGQRNSTMVETGGPSSIVRDMLKSLPLLPLLLCLACSDTDASTAGGVSFVSPKDNDTVTSPVTVEFAVTGKECVAAETHVGDDGYGHHHIIVDQKMPIPKGEMVPKDEPGGFYHHGKAESKATLTLSPGKHTLTLQFADDKHLSYGPDWSKTITITVEE